MARGVGSAIFLLLMVCAVVPAAAWMDVENPVVEMGYNPNGIFILDGSYVMNVGEVQINITNWGLIGSTYSIARPWSDAPSCQWPAGSGNEYLWSSGLWVGGVVLGERLCSTGGFGSEFYPQPEDLEATIYEAVATKVLRPAGNPEASGNRDPMPGLMMILMARSTKKSSMDLTTMKMGKSTKILVKSGIKCSF